MGDWADMMDFFGGKLPPDIALAQMVPGSRTRIKRPAPKPKTVGASKPSKSEGKQEKP